MSSSGRRSAAGAGGRPATAAGARAVKLGAPALTLKALVALHNGHPRMSQIGFAFTVSVAAHVRIALARRVDSRGHAHWQPLGPAVTLAAARGKNLRRLQGSSVLRAGTYRLTLTLASGASRSLVFAIG